MIYLFLADGFEETEAIVPLDLLRRAGKQVTTVGVGGEEIRGSHGVTVRADIPDVMFRDANPEAVILPGGMPGTRNLDASQTVDSAVRVCVKNGGLLCAICAAPIVPGKRGLLANREAICYPGHENELEGAIISEKRVVRDGNIITAIGPGAAVEFGFAIVEALSGKRAADDLRHVFIAN